MTVILGFSLSIRLQNTLQIWFFFVLVSLFCFREKVPLLAFSRTPISLLFLISVYVILRRAWAIAIPFGCKSLSVSGHEFGSSILGLLGYNNRISWLAQFDHLLFWGLASEPDGKSIEWQCEGSKLNPGLGSRQRPPEEERNWRSKKFSAKYMWQW